MSPPRRSVFDQRRVQLAIVVAASVMFWTSLYMYVPVLPTYARSLGASLGLVGLVIGAYGLSQIVCRIPIGLLSDRWRRRRSFMVSGLIANSLGAAVMAVSPSAWILVAGRAVTGVGASSFVVFSIYLTEFFPIAQISRATGLAVMISAGSQLVIMLVGGVVAEHFGVTITFWIATGLGLAGVLMLLPLPESIGAATATTGNLRARVRRGFRPEVRRAATLAGIMQFGMFASTYGFVPLYAGSIGATAAQLGVIATVSVAAGGSAALLLAVLGNRVSSRAAAVAGFGIAAVGTLVVPLIHDTAILALSQGVGGFGRGLVMPALMALSLRHVPRRERATAMGVFQAIYAIGMFAGPAVSGILADALGLAGVFLLIGATSVSGAALAIPLLRARPQPAPAPTVAM